VTGVKTLMAPIFNELREAALARKQARIAEAETHLDFYLTRMSRLTGIDFSKYDLDETLPVLTSNGHQTMAARCSERTPRDIIRSGRSLRDVDLAGTPETVAPRMPEIIDAAGGDGLLVTDPERTRRYIAEIADGLVPAPRRLGVVRTHYEHVMPRDNPLAF